MKELLEAGKVIPVIDKTYPLSEVAEAIRYLEEGHAKGKVVITVEPTASDNPGRIDTTANLFKSRAVASATYK